MNNYSEIAKSSGRELSSRARLAQELKNTARAPMKLYKIGQPWQNEPLIENKTEFIDNNQARFACQERKISNPKPRKARRLSNFV
jgi:hypothetical protein